MKIYSIHDNEFKTYGKVYKDYDMSTAIEKAAEYPMPDSGIGYIPNFEPLLDLVELNQLAIDLMGDIDVQIGCCNGYNTEISTIEYHKCSEINIACTDIILLYGHTWDMVDNTYDLSKLVAFMADKGEVFELYSTTLHYAPIQVQDSGFETIVILPAGTGLPLSNKTEDLTLVSKNKWMLAHKDDLYAKENAIVLGLTGEIVKPTREQ